MALNQQLNAHVRFMYDQGLLEELQFDQLQQLKDANNPDFIVDVITLFCEDTDRILGELDKYKGAPVLDCYKVGAYVHQLKGSSSSVGAQRVTLACVNFRQAFEENDMDRCRQAVNMISEEYSKIRKEFEKMVQGSAHGMLAKHTAEK
ncbi:hypothetical protein GIB67_012937 [Kingdonia uniflora]|uniref:Histidine-containing phosphotransfer protein n=1 Tax=Kingdonia uniflora TaxID=39325 RepID=A0A7J7NGA7_9MAGN|nr:hypothetical protein GIB67_012937 [Kingdonia uniflora]